MPRHDRAYGVWTQPGRTAGNKRRKPSRRRATAARITQQGRKSSGRPASKYARKLAERDSA